MKVSSGESVDVGVFSISSTIGRNRILFQPYNAAPQPHVLSQAPTPVPRSEDDVTYRASPGMFLNGPPPDFNADCPAHALLNSWLTATRLSAFEHGLLCQLYTEALLHYKPTLQTAQLDVLAPIAGRSGNRKPAKHVQMEGWLEVRKCDLRFFCGSMRAIKYVSLV